MGWGLALERRPYTIRPLLLRLRLTRIHQQERGRDERSRKERLTGAEDVVWDLSVFYQGLDDPQMEADIASLTDKVDDFQARYRGNVAQMSAADFVSAYEAMEAIYDLRGRLGAFAFLNFSTDTGDAGYQAAVARIEELESALSQKMVFFDLEWNALDDERAAPFWTTRPPRNIATTWKRSAATVPTI